MRDVTHEIVIPQISALLEDLTAALPSILGENLVGIYLYGSLTQGAFDPERSDVDCIVVMQHELTDAQFTEFDGWFVEAAAENPWVPRLQVSFLIRDKILVYTPDGNCLYQFGRLTRVGCDGNPIIWMNVLESGIVLFGPPADSFVPPITSEILHAALEREVGYLREEIVEKPDSEWRDVPMYRAYAVLTLCRILYSQVHGTVVSKPRAAEWALSDLPEWHDLIHMALDSDAGKVVSIDPARIADFIEFADLQLQNWAA